jgi:CDGSH-type Zn-finger protein
VACAPNGPLLLEGAFEVKDAAGAVVASGGKVALCRCGQSSRKPFCDGAHRRVGFTG